MFADIMSVVAFIVAASALAWQIKTEYRNEPVVTVRLTQEYDKKNGLDLLTITVVNWGRADVTINNKGVRLFNGQMVDDIDWMSSTDPMPRRLQSHSSTTWYFWPESVSKWCDENGVNYYDLVPYVIMANGKTVLGNAELPPSWKYLLTFQRTSQVPQLGTVPAPTHPAGSYAQLPRRNR